MPKLFRVRLAGESDWRPLERNDRLVYDLELAIQVANDDFGDDWCELTNGEQSAMRGNRGIVRSTDAPDAKRFDVNASVIALNGSGSDGAYDLIGAGQTPEELCAKLLAVLKGDWGLTCGTDVPCYLEIHIGPAGMGDDLPL